MSRVAFLACERQLLERAQAAQDEPALVLADETVVLEATEDGVHLAQASRGEIRERVLRDPQRLHVSARILDTEPPRRLDERRRDPGAEVLRQEARQTQHERDPALRHER